ncbi:sensor histidine kinase KdpD [uncultured Phenylobacterium sp.]|uniref:sensor histidine kinase n=1 Tax=uncultured Phenylobacterium sp. TaxID=349273 RepID=UPI0025F16525|nr:HAMP domain-containing sensor histidine kinase [uncultured Phenylobacterium sp.]
MAALDPHRPASGGAPSAFRRTLAATGLLALAALVAMAVVMTSGLARADALLERLRSSQDQLAQVTRIQSDVNRMRADVATGRPGVAARVVDVEKALDAYRRSVAQEILGPEERSQTHAGEIADAGALARMFTTLREPFLAGTAPPEVAESAFEALTDRVVVRERAEAGAASLAMSDLRRTITVLAVAIPTFIALLGAAGAWLMYAANRDLEHQVGARTSEIEAGRAALAEVDANRRLFFARIGHELRTPATVIRGEAEVVLRDPAADVERLRASLGIVAANSQVLQRRLEDMLALARAEDGRIAIRREPVDLAEVAHRAAALAEPYVRANGLQLVTDVDSVATSRLDGDASWLQQAILALVDNAAKFADPGEPIRLTLSHQATAARITVADSGPGVEPCDLANIFDPWRQTAAGRARGGSGLGLSVARWVVEQHGGDIRAQSSPGRGLTVVIDLPLLAEVAARP